MTVCWILLLSAFWMLDNRQRDGDVEKKERLGTVEVLYNALENKSSQQIRQV